MELHEKRKCKCMEHRGDESWHGCTSGYGWHRCYCTECRVAFNSYYRDWRLRNPDAFARHVKKWHSENRESEKARKRNWALNNPVAESARRSRTRARHFASRRVAVNAKSAWTLAEDEIAIRRDITTADKAKLTGRSIQAINARRTKLRKKGLL